jgi:predicted dehydrogenase
MLKVAIIGCGKIADSHAEQLQHISGCEMVGVCDREELMAKQLYERFPIKAFFSNVEELLEKARPDVVHITTPPQSHFELGLLCLERGCHAYIEKPFTITATEARELIRVAQERNLKLTVGNDALFTPAAKYFRSLVREGYLGGDPVHMESYYCSELEDSYARSLLGDRRHWVRSLPGKLLHNIISHGVVRIAEFLKSDAPEVLAYGSISPLLQKLGEKEIVDELRAIVADKGRSTAYFTFSSQMRPSLHQFRIYGPKNGLVLDDDEQCVIKLQGRRYKSYAEKFIPPVGYAKQYLSNFARNLKLFLTRDFHMKAGMRNLITEFYGSITTGQPMPIAYRDIILTCQVMDDIFRQLPTPALPGESGPPSYGNDVVPRVIVAKQELVIPT